MSKTSSPLTGADIEIVVSRALNFPPETVFDAWLDPISVGRWLFATPNGKMERIEIDPRVGGRFTIAERRGDQLAEHFGEFVEIDRPRKLAFKFTTSWSAEPTWVTIEVRSSNGGSHITLTHKMAPEWAEYKDKTRKGWTKILEGLDQSIATGFELVITRVFNAPRELVFACWTEREHTIRWFCPKDFTMLFVEADVRPGGKWSSGMRSPEGDEYTAQGIYREIVRPERLVFTHLWTYDDKPRPETLITVELVDLDGKTEMTFTHTGLPSVESRDAHEGGWSEAFDNLAGYLGKVKGEK